MKTRNLMVLAGLVAATSAFAQNVTVSFQQGDVNAYAGTADAQIRQNAPTSNVSTGANIFVDDESSPAGSSNDDQALLRFDNIIGSGATQIPVGARIVSARLILDTNDQGNGARFYRMVSPWVESSVNWNTFAAGTPGIDIDGIEARTEPSVLAGLADFINFGGTVGTVGMQTTGSVSGDLNLDVTADIQAWVDGETNNGWALLPWNPGLNGWAFSTKENATQAIRPRLVVTYTLDAPVGTKVTFRPGVDNYTAAQDTLISEDEPARNFALEARNGVDFPSTTSGLYNGTLIQFNDFIGSSAGQVPAGSKILRAYLEIHAYGNDAPGNGGALYRLLEAWDQNTVNYQDFFGGNGMQADGIELSTGFNGQIGPADLSVLNTNGLHQIDVTRDVQAFVDGVPNFGWGINPWLNGTNGFFFMQTEWRDIPNRPALVIEYAPADNKIQGTVNLQEFTGSPLGQAATIEIIDSVGTTVETGNLVMNASGEYVYHLSSSFPVGNYDVRIKGSHWLSDLKTGISLGAGTAVVDVSLLNGDVDGDNSVTIFDYIDLSTSFDLSSGMTGYDARADLDGDGSVTIFDYIVLSNNFDLSGL